MITAVEPLERQDTAVSGMERGEPWPGSAVNKTMQTTVTKADNDSDRHLVAAVCCGSRAAAAALYDRYSAQMLAIARRVLGNGTDAEDLVHDVFLEAWQNAKGYDANRGSVRTWLLLRLRSRAIDRVRSLATARQHQIMAAVDEESLTEQDHTIQRVEEKTALITMGRLPPDQQKVLQLSYFGGLTCREIAATMGIPIGTVKSRLAAALDKLRRQLCASVD